MLAVSREPPNHSFKETLTMMPYEQVAARAKRSTQLTSCSISPSDGAAWVGVAVQLVSTPGALSLQINGLGEVGAREARIRVRSALAGAGFTDTPDATVAVMYGGAMHAGHQPQLDLAIALAVLAAKGELPASVLGADGLLAADTVILGGLSLSGDIHPVRGVLPMLLHARSKGARRAIVASANRLEAAEVGTDAIPFEVMHARTLGEVIAALRGGDSLPVALPKDAESAKLETARLQLSDMNELPKGFGRVRRALEIAAAGGHNLILEGEPGVGLVLSARRLAGILPPMHRLERLEATSLHSLAGMLPSGLLTERPFRAPHHTVSEGCLATSAVSVTELQLATHGVLLLDQIHEFRKTALAQLFYAHDRMDMTRRHLPPLLVGTLDPGQYDRIQAVAPRFDLWTKVARRSEQDDSPQAAYGHGESTSTVRARVTAAHEYRLARNQDRPNGHHTTLDGVPPGCARAELTKTYEWLAYGPIEREPFIACVLRVARTIADLAQVELLTPAHVEEALRYVRLDERMATEIVRSTPPTV